MHGLPGHGGGQGGGAVPGVHDDQRGAAAVVPGRVQAPQQVADLPGGLLRPGGGRGALDIDQRGPRGAQGPSAATNWYSQPGMVLRVLSQRQAS